MIVSTPIPSASFLEIGISQEDSGFSVITNPITRVVSSCMVIRKLPTVTGWGLRQEKS